MSSSDLKAILVVQLTGRMHYAAAKELNRRGRLAALLTDFWVPQSLRACAKWWPVLDNYRIDLPRDKLCGNPLVGLEYRARLRVLGHFNTETHVRASQKLAIQAARLSRSLAFDAVYSFDIQALETFRAMKDAGKHLILEQCVAPRSMQIQLLNKLRGEYSLEMFDQRQSQLSILARREKEEWSLADKIICPSNFVRDELIRCGVSPNRIGVVPYGFSSRSKRPLMSRARSPREPLKAIFVGTAEPRKGLTTLVTAMDRVGDEVTLDLYGDLSRGEAISQTKSNIVVHGKVPFRRLQEVYAAADVLVLPSYLEGSATVVYEALSAGLPCIVTPETGSVVTDGWDGFIVPSGDPDSIANRLVALAQDPALQNRMSLAAFATAEQYTVSRYGDRLCEEV